MEFKAKCEICNKEYDNYMRTYYIEDGEIKTCCCLDCKSKYLKDKEFVYWNHIPTFCDGGDIVWKVFNTKEELLSYIPTVVGDWIDDYIIAIGDRHIIKMYKNKKSWWVYGFVSCDLDLPDFNEMVDLYDNDGVLRI